MSCPSALEKIVAFFESLPEQERRENLIAYADRARNQEPQPGEVFDFEDVRQDADCTDTVGIFLQVDQRGRVKFRITLGPQVQTLTRAMTTILCQGLGNSTLLEVAGLSGDCIEKIVGSQLLRLRSQTVFYVLRRMQQACAFLLENEAARSATDGE